MTDTDNGAVKQGSALAQLGNLFVAPSQALDYAREHTKMWWLPFGITLGLQLILGIWIAATINIEYMRRMAIMAITRANPDAAQRAGDIASNITHERLMLVAVVMVAIFGVIELIFALYLFFADKLLSAANRDYGQWFSLTAWTWLPFSIGTIIAGIVWALSSHATGTPSNPTTLNALFFHFNPAANPTLYKASQFSLLGFWVIGLVAFGVKRWCGYSTLKAVVITLIPFVVFYAIYALI